MFKWWKKHCLAQDLNPRPSVCEAGYVTNRLSRSPCNKLRVFTRFPQFCAFINICCVRLDSFRCKSSVSHATALHLPNKWASFFVPCYNSVSSGLLLFVVFFLYRQRVQLCARLQEVHTRIVNRFSLMALDKFHLCGGYCCWPIHINNKFKYALELQL